MVSRDKILVTAALVAAAAALTHRYAIKPNSERARTEYLNTLESNMDIVKNHSARFTEAIMALRDNPNKIQNAYDADRAGAAVFLSLYGATNSMDEGFRQIMWTTNFLDDAKTCAESYPSDGDNQDIGRLVDNMREMSDIGRTLALKGPSEDLQKRAMAILTKYASI